MTDIAQIDAVETHDCFTTNEVISYEALGLTDEGTAEKFIADGDNTYGGRTVTNPSGGLLSKGHPLGATGAMETVIWIAQVVLATVFVHSRLMERALVPYVVASQTIPILALAPLIAQERATSCPRSVASPLRAPSE